MSALPVGHDDHAEFLGWMNELHAVSDRRGAADNRELAGLERLAMAHLAADRERLARYEDGLTAGLPGLPRDGAA